MCPFQTGCNETVSVSDNQWHKDKRTLLDGEVCVHRIKYDTIHMNETVFDLSDVSGDTSFTESDLSTYDKLTVQVRLTSSSTYF